MLEIFLIRHAESAGNLRLDIVGGRSNHLPITPLGVRQAQWLGERLKTMNLTFDKVATSSARRTKETLAEVVTALELDWDSIEVSDELLELEQGDWQGLPRKEVYTPDVMAQIAKDPWNFKAPGGESQREVEERIWAWLEREVIRKYSDGAKILVVTHGVAIKCLLRKILDSAPPMTYKIAINNTSITKICLHQERGWYLEMMNDTAHFWGR